MNPLLLRILVSAQDQASKVFSSLLGVVTKLGAALAALATWAGANFFGDAISQAADLEKQFSILAAKTGATQAELAALKAKADEIGASDTLSVTTSDTAKAMTTLAAAGMDVRQVLDAITPVIAMANSESMDLARAAEIVTANLAGFGLGADQAGRIADVLATAANSSKTTVEDLASALSYASASARAAGMSIEETTAAIALMQGAGVDGSRAGTALVAMLGALSDTSSTASIALRDAGIASRDFSAVVDLLTSGTPAAQRAINAFGLEAGPGLQSLLGRGEGAIQAYTAALNNVQGASEGAAKTATDNLRGSLDALAGVWDALKISVGESLLPRLTQEVRDLAGALADFTKSNAFEALKRSIADTFSEGASAIRRFIETVDFAVIGQRVTEFTASIPSRMAAVAQAFRDAGAAVDQAKAIMAPAISAIQAAWNGLQATVNLVAMSVTGSLSLVMGGINEVTQGASRLGLVSDDIARSSQAAFDALVEGSRNQTAAYLRNIAEMSQAGQQFGRDVKAALLPAAEATQAVAAATTQQAAANDQSAEAATRKADADKALRAEIEATQAALEGQADAQAQATQRQIEDTQSIEALTAARDAQVATIEANNRAIEAGAEAGKQMAAARLQWLEAVENLNAAMDQEKAGVEGAREGVWQWSDAVAQARAKVEALEAKVKAGAKAKADDEILTKNLEKANKALAGAYGIAAEKAQRALDAAERQTAALEEEGALRVQHIRNLAREAEARGDVGAAAEYERRASAEAALAAVDLASETLAAARAAEAKAEAMRASAVATGDTSDKTLEAIAIAQADADAKRGEAAAAEELARTLMALRGAQGGTTQSTQDYTGASQGAADATEKVTTKISGAAAMMKHMREEIEQAISSIREYSDSAADAVQSIIDSADSWYDKIARIRELASNFSLFDTGEIAESRRELASLSEAMESVQAEIGALQDKISRADSMMDWTPWHKGLLAMKELEKAAIAAAIAEERMTLRQAEMAEALDELNRKLDDQTITIAEYEREVERLQGTYRNLGDEDLDTLRDALQDAKDKTDALRESAETALEEALKVAEEAGLGSTVLQREEIKHKQTMADLEEQLAEARAAGDAQAIRDLEQAIALREKAHAARMQQLRDELAAEEAVTQEQAKRDETPTTRSPGRTLPDVTDTPDTAGATDGGMQALAGAFAGAVGKAMDGAIQTQTRQWEDATNRMFGALDGAIRAQTQALANTAGKRINITLQTSTGTLGGLYAEDEDALDGLLGALQSAGLRASNQNSTSAALRR